MGQPQPARGRDGCREEKCASLDNGVTHLVLIKDSATSQSLSGGFHPLEQMRETPQEKGGKQTMELSVQRLVGGGGGGPPSLGHYSVAGTCRAQGMEERALSGEGSGQVNRPFAIWSDWQRSQEQGHRSRGRWPSGHHDLSNKPSK